MDKKDKLTDLSQWSIVQEVETGHFWQPVKNNICTHKKRNPDVVFHMEKPIEVPSQAFLSLNDLDLYFVWSSQNETFSLSLAKNKLAVAG